MKLNRNLVLGVRVEAGLKMAEDKFYPK